MSALSLHMESTDSDTRSRLHKFDELFVTVNTLKHCIICIIASWLSSEISDGEILIPGYQLCFDRHCHGGGVLMYVFDEFLVSVLPPPSPPLTLSVLSVNFKLYLGHCNEIVCFWSPPASILRAIQKNYYYSVHAQLCNCATLVEHVKN